MKSTTRGTLAAVIAGVAAAVGAGATPAAAVGTVPVPVPLKGVEKSLDMELPRLGAELPLPKPGAPEGPGYAEGRLLPERALPQLPISGGLPGADLHAPLPHVLGDGFDHLNLDAPAFEVSTLAPGLAVDAPLSSPNPRRFGLPDVTEPQAGVVGPALRTVPGASLGTGPGL
ncbi:hypothetical protein [Streptomyces olivochromogenes]|uniref:hypothetical protein n=1 Tax=Streptomyces olivochromogenes TaxID=1963 RepID=UPI001F3D6117|nr:hypothetical protein [Streptomyces olivochromogenes]MCF3136199.1 hypothetical protein [Streptomyces olivochromogenes]